MRQMSAALRIRFDERLEERTRLARDLHDTLMQTIQGSKMVVDNARESPLDSPRMQKAMDRLSEWLGRAVVEGRAALAALRSSATEGNDLADALRRVGDDCQINRAMPVSLLLHGRSREMHPIARDEVYLIGYEAIRNACMHSGGTQVIVELEYGQDLRLRIRDNGHGMSQEILQFGKAGHFGLKGMRERAGRIGGRLTLFSSQGKGTEICLVVPGSAIFKIPYSVIRRSSKRKIF
jgi:signal transduction histidine kinase